MTPRPWFDPSRGIAAWLGSLAACATLTLGLVSCDKKKGTPDWDTPGGEAPAIEAAAPESPPEPVAESSESAPAAVAPPPAADPSTSGLRFIAYNVENWLTMDRYVDRKLLKNLPKPTEQKEAAIRLLVAATPDVIGLCEIGEAADLAEIQQSLKAAGLDLPHSHYIGGSDPVRHLGLLSRFPILFTSKPAETDFRLQGRTFSINRGILDATIEARGKPYRFLGVHLKSKRSIEEADQEEMRVHEARLLRRHVDALLKEDPQARLVVYGDFNDTRPSNTFKTITGSYNDPGYLTALPLKDSRGHAWTHHWAPHDIYSRIDFITVSRALRSEVDFQASHLIDSEDWQMASDHRALLAIFY
jgi:endonuclease/exonuclease/phosphatase family metal-dependent hydrolase